MNARMASLLAASLMLTACGESGKESTAPAVQPRFAYFSQDVANISNRMDSVLERVQTPNITRTGDFTYTSTSAPNLAWRARFFPATRVIDDTVFTVSLNEWTWIYTDTLNHEFPQRCTSSDCVLTVRVKSLKLSYRMKVVAPVHIAAIQGRDNIPSKDTYSWTVSATGGDVAAGFSYAWRLSTDGGASWTTVGSQQTYTRPFTESTYPNFTLRAVATNSGRSDSTIKAVTVANPLVGNAVLNSATTDPSPPVQYTPFTLTVNGSEFNPATVEIVYSQPCSFPVGAWCQGGGVRPAVSTSTQLVAYTQVFGTAGPLQIRVRNGPNGPLSSPAETTIQPRY